MNKKNLKIEEKGRKTIKNRNFQKYQITIQTDFLNIYKQLNERLFDNSLPLCQIAFYPIPDSYGEVYLTGCTHNKTTFPFLVLNPQYFKNGVYFVVEVLLHEMVHIFCFINGIEDINYHTGYHNLNFKKACNRINLRCRKNVYGYSNTYLTPHLKTIIRDILKSIHLVKTLPNCNYNI